jgi:hypothetical protein
MNFIQAKKLFDMNQQLIGRQIKGATIDELVICPTDKAQYEDFIKRHLTTHKGSEAILPFLNEDLDIFCVLDKQRIKVNSTMLVLRLKKVGDYFDINYPSSDI